MVGAAAKPRALLYRKDKTLPDAKIAVGAITDFAVGNGASKPRSGGGKIRQCRVRLKDLVRGSDPPDNVTMRPGDALIIALTFGITALIKGIRVQL